MKKLIIFLLCVAVIGGGSWFGYRKYMEKKKESIVVDVVPVSLMMQPAEWFEYGMEGMDGQIVAASTQRVYIDTEKLVKTVFVEEGQQVKKGDPILEYDMTVVELELTQKENGVKIAEQDLKMAKKELENIRRYKPAEDAPQPTVPDYPDIPDDFDIPEEPEIPELPELPADSEPEPLPEPPKQLVSDIIKPAFTPVEGVGTPESPFIINCLRDTEVSKEFMIRIMTEKRYVEICVYDQDLKYLYKWIIMPSEDTELAALDSWNVSDGISIDEEGQASIDPTVKLYGKLSFTHPTKEKSDEPVPDEDLFPDEEPTPEEDEVEEPEDDPEYEPQEFVIDPDSNDYVYSREAIKKMIAEQENEIKLLEIELKSANFELATAKKRKQDGKLYAEIDGIVKKIGKVSGEEDTEEDAEEEDPYEEPSEDDRAFAVIQGEGGTEVLCEVSELNLGNISEGDLLDVMSWNSGSSATAEVTSIDKEPRSYSMMSWGQNPNNSSYILHAKVTDGADDMNIGEWVQVKLIAGLSGDNDDSSGSVYIPIHYVHKEGGDYYIMKTDENDRLKKQYVRVGQIMYGAFIEIKGGIDAKDKICFPYGKDVKEGVKTRETTEVLQPENSDIFY